MCSEMLLEYFCSESAPYDGFFVVAQDQWIHEPLDVPDPKKCKAVCWNMSIEYNVPCYFY